MADSLVLCYHALSRSWEADLATTPERFERQLRLLLGRGYRAVCFSEAVQAPATDPVFAVTFDDAYRTVLELGLPILQSLGITATVFAPTDYIGSERLIPMSWPELGELAAAGWEVGSHTGSHPHLTKLDASALADELARSKAACEQHLPGSPCSSLALRRLRRPGGGCDRPGRVRHRRHAAGPPGDGRGAGVAASRRLPPR